MKEAKTRVSIDWKPNYIDGKDFPRAKTLEKKTPIGGGQHPTDGKSFPSMQITERGANVPSHASAAGNTQPECIVRPIPVMATYITQGNQQTTGHEPSAGESHTELTPDDADTVHTSGNTH